MIRVWGRSSSSNVQKVLWALDELRLPFAHEVVGGPLGGLDRPEFVALTPVGRVPVIDVDGFALWESQAILRYLARRYGAALDLGTAEQAALIDQWLDFSLTTWQPPVTRVFWQVVRLPARQRSDAALTAALAETDAASAILDARLAESPWLGGDRFSIADIGAGLLLYRYFDMDIPRPDRPALLRWYQDLQERPPFRSRVMTSYEELRARDDGGSTLK
ncbi:MAG: glutathione S-transferase family protein [Pseudomonadota bacterium]